jgi:hypothetical protein
MFERYTENARRVIFFARYEASQLGQTQIESEHLLLGLLREDKALSNRLLRQHSAAENIRVEVEGRTGIREKVSTSVDMPLSNECKRILHHSAEEADEAGHKHIGTEHLLAGILREERCYGAELLKAHGVTLEAVRNELRSSAPDIAAWPGTGLGAARVVSGSGIHKPPVIEFVCGEATLIKAMSFGPPPRIGESVQLRHPDSAPKSYRVRDVIYHYEMPSETAREAAVAAENVGAVPLGARPLIPETITVELEAE